MENGKVRNGLGARSAQQSLLGDIHSIDPDCSEWIYDIGRVTSVRVIYALAAIQRLGVLLGREQGG